MSACTPKGGAESGYVITGTAEGTVDGDTVYMCDMQGFFAFYPTDTAIEMITHTIEGDYPEIYPPNQAILAKAARRAKKTTDGKSSGSRILENQIFGAIIKLLPQELRPAAFGPGGQSRNALYITIDGTTAQINIPGELKEWTDNNKQVIDEAVHAILPQATIEYNIYRTTTPGTSSQRVV